MIIVMTALITMQVTIGKKNDPLSVFKKMSPGSFPKGNFLMIG